MQQHLRRSTQAQSEPRRQTWTQRAKALCLAGLMALASTPLWAQTNQPPILGLTQPWEGANFNAPANVTLAAWAYDADGIQSIAFYDGATLLATDTQAPYEFQWTNVPAGSHSITARATDTRGSVATSTAMSFTVNGSGPNQPPILGLTQPWEGANFNAPANVTLAAWAYDADGIQSIAFYDGATLLATDTQAPYEFQWTNVPAGSHSITARATDTRGSVATSTAMSFTVNGSGPNQPPILGLTQPWEGANFNAPANVTLAAWAYDADGIQSIAFYDGATLLATDTQAPYEFQWANVPAGSHNITARATDTRGSVATSTAMSFTVNGSGPNQPPILGLTQPWEGANFNAPANVTLAAWAYDADGIQSIAFYDGATLLATDTQAPYEFQWTNVPAGSHNITARATDTRGSVATSAAMTFTVNGNASNQAPTVNLTAPAAGASYTAPATVNITANAADSDGSIASVAFYNGATLLGTDASAPYSFSWSNVAAGSYSVTARATDNQGAMTTSAAVAVTVNAPANAAPTVSLTAPAPGTSFTAPATVSITADAADSDGSIASVAFYNGASLLGTDTTAPYSFSWTDAPAGAHSLTARATDDDGATTTSAAVSVTVSAANQTPTVVLTSPATGVQFTAPASITLTADATDSDGTVASVAFYNGATLLGTDTSAPYSYSWTNVAAGSYSVTARVTDNQGAMTTSAAVAVTVNAPANAAPTVSLTAPAPGTSFTAPATVNITANATDSDGSIASVAFYNGATLLGTDTSAPYSYSWSNVAAGSYSITARATDNQGAVTTSAAVAVTVNALANAAPTVSLTAPAAGASFTAPATVNITADAMDSDGSIGSVAFYNGATLLGTDTTAPYSFSWADAPAGTYSLTARAIDDDGASTTSAAVSVTVSAANQAPTVALTAPVSGAEFTAPASISLTADATDSDGNIASVAFYNGATLLGTDTTAPYSFSWADAPAGTYSLTARATDDDGASTTSAAVSVTVNAANQTPSVALTSPAAGAEFTAPASITLTADATDPDGSIASVAFYNGATLLGTDTSAPYRFSWTNVPAGSYSVTAQATDNSGAITTSAAVAVTVNAPANVAPTVNLTAPTAGASFTAPASITLTANAADSDGSIASVAFYNGATLLGTDTSAPYSYNWTNVAAGSYSVTAQATDNSGATGISTAVAVTVNAPANVAPTVSLTAPTAGASFTAPATVNITADAMDSDGNIASVAFYNGATLLGTDTTAPYSFSWSDVSAGNYTLTAVTTDNSGAVTTSAAVTVTVNAPANQAPTVSLTAPAADASFTAPATVSISADAADSDGSVASVSFYNGTTLLGTDTTAPYSFSWSNVAAGSYSITAVATDNQGAITTSVPLSVTVGGAGTSVTVVNLISPAPGATYAAPASITIAAEVSVASGRTLRNVWFYANDAAWGFFTQPPYQTTRPNVLAGTYNVKAVATDDTGATFESATVTVTVAPDAHPPTVRIQSPGVGAFINGPTDVTLTATAKANPERTLSSVSFYNGATLLGTVASAPYTLNTGVLQPGIYSITARATDSAGDVTTSAVRYLEVGGEVALPSVAIRYPLAEQQFQTTAGIPIVYEVSKGRFRANNSIEIYSGQTLISTTRYTESNRYVWRDAPAGRHSLTVVVVDGAGTRVSSQPVDIVVSDQPPVLNMGITTPAQGQAVPRDGDVRAYFYDPASQIASTEFLLTHDGVTTTRTWSLDEGTDYRSANRSLIALGATTPGAYSLVVRALDAAGNELLRSSARPFVLSSAPFVVVSEPLTGHEYAAPAVINVMGRATTSTEAPAFPGLDRVEVYLGATLVSSNARVGATANFSATLPDVPVGVHDIRVRAYALDGSYTEEIRRVRVMAADDDDRLRITQPVEGAEILKQVGADGVVFIVGGVAGRWDQLAEVNVRGTGTGGWSFNGPIIPGGQRDWMEVRLTPVGPWSVQATAETQQGGLRYSQKVGFNIYDRSIAIWNPNSFGMVPTPGRPWTMHADAKDCTGCIAGVEFLNGETVLARVNAPPYELNAASLPVGTYSITARMLPVDASRGTLTSAAVNVTVVANAVPTVALTSPAAGAVLGPYQNVTLTATASDADGTVAKVDFYNGEQLLASRTTAPYTYIWRLGAAGEYVFSARATDNQGAVTTSAAVTVNVAVPNQAPTVSLTSPAAGASFTAPASITLTADAADADGSIASVAFYNGATLLGTTTSAPYSFSWTNVPAGSYSITAQATDNGGATTTSAAVAVTVEEDTGETITYIHTDVSGSPLAATNANGNVVWKENYRAYGERQLEQPGSEGQGQWFHGKQADATTGLQYFGARYYDPAVGRFMGVDPVGFQEDNLHSFNRYAYGNNNPVKYLDPDGNNPIIGFLLLSALFLELDSVASGNPPTPLGPMGPVVGRGLIKGGAAAAGREGAEAVAAKGPIHHICTNKNCVSTASGGPWTPRFEAIFQKAGMKLDDALNKITVPGHKGPHPEAYHQAVFRRLEGATSGLNGKAYRDALQAELGAIGREIQTQGSALNKLLTKP